MARVVVVTGANKGIGFAVVQALCQEHPDWVVYLTCRDLGRAQIAQEKLISIGLYPRTYQLDITLPKSVMGFREYIFQEHGGFDVLINNAAISFDDDSTESFGEQAMKIFKTNYYGFINLCNELLPLIRSYGRIVNVSSCAGHRVFRNLSPDIQRLFSASSAFSDLDAVVESFLKAAEVGNHVSKGWANSAYGTSKLAVTYATYLQSRSLLTDSRNIIINACDPGYVATDMTKHKGEKSAEEGAKIVLYLACIPQDDAEPQGRFVKDDRSIDDLPQIGKVHS